MRTQISIKDFFGSINVAQTATDLWLTYKISSLSGFCQGFEPLRSVKVILLFAFHGFMGHGIKVKYF